MFRAGQKPTLQMGCAAALRTLRERAASGVGGRRFEHLVLLARLPRVCDLLRFR